METSSTKCHSRKWKVEFDDEFLKQLNELPEDVKKEVHKQIKKLSESDNPVELGEKLE